MISALVLAGLLGLIDPSGDTVGDGSLTPPSNEVLRTLSAFDVLELTTTGEPGFSFDLTMGSLSNPFDAPNGFSLPIIELYVATFDPGHNALLPGSGMRLPEGQSWTYAFRLTGDLLQVFRALDGELSAEDITDDIKAQLIVEDNRLRVETRLELPDYSVYGLVGLYDPFADNPWRPLSQEASPWAFSSDSQRYPVVDIIAESRTAQQDALATGILPRITPARPGAPVNLWLLLMIGGVMVSLSGFAVRAFWLKPSTSDTKSAHSFVEDEAQLSQLTTLGSSDEQGLAEKNKEAPGFPSSFDDSMSTSLEDVETARLWQKKQPSMALSAESSSKEADMKTSTSNDASQ